MDDVKRDKFGARIASSVWVVPVVTGHYKVLVGRRAPWLSHPGTWGLFGGSIDDGERPLQAAKRELKEETGLGSRDWKLLWKDRHPRDPSMHAHYFKVTLDYPQTPRLNEENDDSMWMHKGELKAIRRSHFTLKRLLDNLDKL